MSDHIKLRKSAGTWVIRTSDAVLGESTRAIELTEGSYPSVMYIPQDDIAMMFLEPSATRSQCPHKGEAVYYSIVTAAGTIMDAAWAYPNPPEPLAAIADCLAFYPEKVAIERV